MVTKPTAEEVAKALYESDCSVAYCGKGQPLPWERLAAVDPNSYERLLRHAEVAIRAVRPKALEEAALETLTTAAMNRATAEGLEMTIRVKEGERCGCPCHQLAKLIRAVRSERDAGLLRLLRALEPFRKAWNLNGFNDVTPDEWRAFADARRPFDSWFTEQQRAAVGAGKVET